MEDNILLAHGSGGQLSHELLQKTILPEFDNPILAKMDDAAVFELSGKLAFTTDSYVVNPIFFPGGDIGKLAVCGTINDLAMCGAYPLYLSLSLIIEEGFARKDLEKILKSIRKTAEEANVIIVTGDTKVVNKGCADKIFINTTGIGKISSEVNISGSNAVPGDKIIISGTIGDHGIAVLSQREGLQFISSLKSDCAPLHTMVQEMLSVTNRIHCMRDPTRGGLATTLNELAKQSGVGIHIEEASIPIKEEVATACEMLGLDPLYITNEGKLVAIVPAEEAEKIVRVMHNNDHGSNAAIIGEVTTDNPGKVFMRTILGTFRIIDMPVGDPLPRIC